MSLCRKIKDKKSAALVAASASAEEMEGLPEYDRRLVNLNQHILHLANLQGREAKIAYKVEILPEFDAYIDGVLEAGRGAQDDILVMVLIWQIDVGNLTKALDIAEYALPSKLASPARFKRDLKNTVTEEISEWALDNLNSDNAYELMMRLHGLVAELDLMDEVKAKLFKSLGILVEDNDPKQALEYYSLALKLNSKCGVKN